MLPRADGRRGRPARRSGIRTGLVSNSWSTRHYDRDLLAELFDDVVISAEVGLHKPEPEIYLSPPSASRSSPASACSSTTCARTAPERRPSG